MFRVDVAHCDTARFQAISQPHNAARCEASSLAKAGNLIGIILTIPRADGAPLFSDSLSAARLKDVQHTVAHYISEEKIETPGGVQVLVTNAGNSVTVLVGQPDFVKVRCFVPVACVL